MRISDWSSDVCSSDLLILGLAGAGLALGLGLSYLVGRSITGPLNRTVTALEELGEGHSDTIVEIDDSRTEIGRLTRAFNQFREKMKETETLRRQPAVAATNGQEERRAARSEEHTSELQLLMRTSYAVFCLHKNTHY